MKSELQHFLSQLRNTQELVKLHAYGHSGTARQGFLEIEGRLARTLGELDYLVNLKIGTTNDDDNDRRSIFHHSV